MNKNATTKDNFIPYYKFYEKYGVTPRVIQGIIRSGLLEEGKDYTIKYTLHRKSIAINENSIDKIMEVKRKLFKEYKRKIRNW